MEPSGEVSGKGQAGLGLLCVQQRVWTLREPLGFWDGVLCPCWGSVLPRTQGVREARRGPVDRGHLPQMGCVGARLALCGRSWAAMASSFLPEALACLPMNRCH